MHREDEEVASRVLCAAGLGEAVGSASRQTCHGSHCFLTPRPRVPTALLAFIFEGDVPASALLFLDFQPTSGTGTEP